MMKFCNNLSHLKKQMKKNKQTDYLALCLQLPSLMLSFSIMRVAVPHVLDKKEVFSKGTQTLRRYQ